MFRRYRGSGGKLFSEEEWFVHGRVEAGWGKGKRKMVVEGNRAIAGLPEAPDDAVRSYR